MVSRSLSEKCGACRMWVTNGMACNMCNCCFHINCASNSPTLIEKSMPWYCVSCKYQKHARCQEARIRYLEQELKAAKEEINFLKAGNSSNKIKDQNNSNDLCNWTKPKNSKSRSRWRCISCSTQQQRNATKTAEPTNQHQLLVLKVADQAHPAPTSQTPVDVSANHLENLPFQAFLELIRCRLTQVSSLPRRDARPQSVFKAVFLFIVEYGSTALKDKQDEPLRLAYRWLKVSASGS
jgi:hypothetical protein